MAPSNNQLQQTLLFFILAFLDEKLAQKVSARFIKELLRFDSENNFDTFFIKRTKQYWEKYQNRAKSSGIIHEATWRNRISLDFISWRQFRKDSQPEEFLTSIWCEVLKLDHDAVAKGTETSVGTVRHRLARATRILGSIVISGAKHG